MTLANDLIVPKEFVLGSDFLLLETSSPKVARCPKQVTLRIDPGGHILYWIPKVGETRSYVFIQDIVDVRTGKRAAQNYVPLKELSSNIQLLMTVVSNVDFVHPNFTTFVPLDNSAEKLAAWERFLFRLATTTRSRHFGVLHHIRKTLAPVLYASETKEISVEQLREILTAPTKEAVAGIVESHRGARSETEKVLLEEITDKTLVSLVLSLGGTERLKKVFGQLCDHGSSSMSRKAFLNFLQTFQRDPRLNEALYPKITERGMNAILRSLGYSQGDVSFEAFVHYLWSAFCVDSPNIPEDRVADSMHEPLSHYFINSSHNTYCTGLQVKGAQLLSSSAHKETVADVEMYRQVLLSGCRCIELDCWDSSDGPVITHGPAALFGMNEIPLKDVCEAISECAFKTSPYPVLLSIENHLSQKQQKLMVQIFRDTFGENLLCDPLESHRLEEGQLLPSPHLLRNKIIIKAKKAKPKVNHRKATLVSDDVNGSVVSEGSFDSSSQADTVRKMSNFSQTEAELALLDRDVVERQLCPVEEELSSQDLSGIVNYLTATKMPSKWNVDRNYFLMCSLSESESMKVYNQRQANNFIKHTSRRLVRVFPAYHRVTSDNYIPKIHWMMGAQMVALNFQTNCSAMLLNHAMFEQTSNYGYVKKPDSMCDPTQEFDIYEKRFPRRLPVTLKVTVLSAMFLPDNNKLKNSPFFVTLDLLDFPPYDAEAKEYARGTGHSGIHVVFDSKQAVFRKILMPEMAFLQICLWRRFGCNATPVAYRTLPINNLQNGYRHVILRTIGNRCLGPLSLFIYFDVFFYVPTVKLAFHSALMNPFSRDREEERLSQALRHPFLKQDEIDEDEREEEKLQALVGTEKLPKDASPHVSPLPSPVADSVVSKFTK
ncbi:hypothetical protein Q1695_003483 [Nippostrongylus brasiliensis]|nr:hypothetical protein Q1695_003483 [Nippostrongylus brasiliensis]